MKTRISAKSVFLSIFLTSAPYSAYADDTFTVAENSTGIDMFFDALGLPGINGLCPSGCGNAKKIKEKGEELFDRDKQLRNRLGTPKNKQQEQIEQELRQLLGLANKTVSLSGFQQG